MLTEGGGFSLQKAVQLVDTYQISMPQTDLS
jgi:hypothetical protein